MEWLRFEQAPLAVVVAIFVASAAAVWFSGSRISGYANAVAERTGIGKAFLGMILLGGVTSLPEVAVSVSAALGDSAALAVNNLLGGVAMQVAILAVADAAIGRDALTSVIARPVVLLQGLFMILLLVIVATAIASGEVSLRLPGPLDAVEFGVWSSALAVAGLASVRLIRQYELSPAWVPSPATRVQPRPGAGGREASPAAPGAQQGDGDRTHGSDEPALRTLLLRIAGAAAVILLAGVLLAQTGEAIAQRTGLGSSFVGAVLVAISTSLPEVSTVLAAVRIRQYEMAISDILGTNLIDVSLIFVVDAVYRGPPVLDEVGTFSLVAALLGVTVTALYLAGLVERRNRTILRMGWDSLAVLVVYAGGLVLLYTLR